MERRRIVNTGGMKGQTIGVALDDEGFPGGNSDEENSSLLGEIWERDSHG